jgi:hypothetical protein
VAKASLTVELWEAANWELDQDTPGSAAYTDTATTNADGEFAFVSQVATKVWLTAVLDGDKKLLTDARNKIQLTDIDIISDLYVDTISEHTSGNGVVIDGVTLKDGGLTLTAAMDVGTANITTGGILKIDVDGTAENAAGSLTLGAGNDAGIFFDGTNLVIITNGVGASGIVLDSEDDTVEIKGSGTLQATFDTGGLNLVTGDTYEINGTSVLNATTLGAAVVTSSLTTVGALASGTIATGFGAIDNGTSNITTGGILKLDVDGTAENAAGSLTFGAGNDAGIFFDGTNLVIITNGAGASGIILDSEDDTVEIKGSGTLQATFDTGGLNLVSGDTYQINGTAVLTNNTLGTGVLTSSLTTVGALNSGSITSGFGNVDIGASTFDTTGAVTTGTLAPAGNLSMGNDALIRYDVNAGLTAGTTRTQAGGLDLTAQVNQVSTVANVDDTVVLPPAIGGEQIIIINSASNRMRVFPASGDDLGAGANNALAGGILGGQAMTFIPFNATTWVEV